MCKELKFMGSTKTDIWNAYKELKEELNSLKMKEPSSTVEIAKECESKKSIERAGKVNITSVIKTLADFSEGITQLKEQYDDITSAIEAKKVELKDVHGIEVSANDLVALATIKEKMLKEADEKAETIKKEADDYYNSRIEAAKEGTAELIKKRNRDNEDYIYITKRNRRHEEDKVEDTLQQKKKSLDELEKSLLEREDKLNDKDSEIVKLEEKVKNLEENLKNEVEKAVSAAEEKAKKSALVTANIVKSSTDADKKIAEAKIESLEATVQDLEDRLKKSNEEVSKANAMVATMATKALQAQADVATVSKVSEIAAGSQKK